MSTLFFSRLLTFPTPTAEPTADLGVVKETRCHHGSAGPCGSLVELLPSPSHDDERAAAGQRAAQPVDHLPWVGYVMKRSRRDCGSVSLSKLEMFELDAVVMSGVRGFGIDTDRFVAA
jgi:hypothetical protein